MRASVDRVGYRDYQDKPIFRKMADEYAKPPCNRDAGIPVEDN